MQLPPKILPYTGVFIKLLKGPVEYLEKGTWEKLMQYKAELTEFLQQLGLTLVVVEQDGYAYVKHTITEEDESVVSWIQRRTLTYEESVMLVLLREMMADFEISEATTRELIKKRREIKDYAEMFFKEKASRVKFLKDIDRLIDKAEENGFLDKTENHDIADEQKFRIKKIIKSKVDADDLDQFYHQLQKHKEAKLAQ
jgi:Sulfite reductase, alpha subunit (flavoprotein)